MLAWAYLLWLAAAMHMGGTDMSGLRMVPAMGLMAPAAAPWSAVEFVFAIWAVMMVGIWPPRRRR